MLTLNRENQLTNDTDNDSVSLSWNSEAKLTVNILGLYSVNLTREIQTTSHSQDSNRVGMVKGSLKETE